MSKAASGPSRDDPAAGRTPSGGAPEPATPRRAAARPRRGEGAAALHLPPPGTFRSLGGAWMVTFTDLIALMLAFFVLLFSMSSLEKQKWRELVGALSEQLNTMTPSDVPRPTVVLQIKTARDPVPGADLDYLEQVLREQLAAEPALAAVALRRAERGVILSLPAAVIFDDVGLETSAAAGELAYPLARLLHNLGNDIEITAVGAAAGAPAAAGSSWDLTLARAQAVSDLLTGAGYGGPLVVRAALARSPTTDSAAERIEITVTQEARGAE